MSDLTHEPEITDAMRLSPDRSSVYAYFGCAAHIAQEFEDTIINLVALLHIKTHSKWTMQFLSDPYKKLDRLTLGQLMQDAKQLMPFDDNIVIHFNQQ
jgi:hypothetical protein